MGQGRQLLSCGVVVVRETAQGLRLLMLRAFNHWDFPKGILESDEDPLQGALREVREETTLDDLVFPWGWDFVETGPYGRGKVARYYLALTHRDDVTLPPNPNTGRPEHVEFRWCTLDDSRRLAVPRVRRVIDWAARRLQGA